MFHGNQIARLIKEKMSCNYDRHYVESSLRALSANFSTTSQEVVDNTMQLSKDMKIVGSSAIKLHNNHNQ